MQSSSLIGVSSLPGLPGVGETGSVAASGPLPTFLPGKRLDAGGVVSPTLVAVRHAYSTVRVLMTLEADAPSENIEA